MADKRFVDFRVDSTPGSGSYLVGHDSAGTEFRIPVSSLLSSIVVPEAQRIYVQYSANGSSWVTVWTSGCKFMRIKIGAGAWSNAMAIADVVNVATMVKVGNTLVGSGSDYVELEAGDNVTLTPDAAHNKVTISATGGGSSAVQSDWEQDDDTAADYIKNKPTIPDAQIQSDWSQSDNTKADFIKNKPTIPSALAAGDLVSIDSNHKINHDVPTGPFFAAMSTLPSSVINNVSAVINVNIDEFGHVAPGFDGGTTHIQLWQLSSPQEGDALVFDNTYKRFKNRTLADVATSGSYNDLNNKPTIPSAPGTLNTNNSTGQSVNSGEALSGTIKLHKVSKTGSYSDLLNKPTIPTVNNSTIIITQGGVEKGRFTLNQSSGGTISLDAGGANVVVIDTIGYDVETYGIAYHITLTENLVFDLAQNCYCEYDGSTWSNGQTPANGTIMYALNEQAYYIYSDNCIEPISKGVALMELRENETSGEYFMYLIPRCDTNSVFVIDSNNSTEDSYAFDICDLTNIETNNFITGTKSVHTLLLKNDKSTDVDFTVTANIAGSNQGVISLGLDNNNSFTVSAGSFVEISVLFSIDPSSLESVPIIIVKDGYNIDLTPVQ